MDFSDGELKQDGHTRHIIGLKQINIQHKYLIFETIHQIHGGLFF